MILKGRLKLVARVIQIGVAPLHVRVQLINRSGELTIKPISGSAVESLGKLLGQVVVIRGTAVWRVADMKILRFRFKDFTAMTMNPIDALSGFREIQPARESFSASDFEKFQRDHPDEIDGGID
jgi:hypothetical protein